MKISKALERDNFMTPEEVKTFGLIDSVVEKENNTQYLDQISTWT